MVEFVIEILISLLQSSKDEEWLDSRKRSKAEKRSKS